MASRQAAVLARRGAARIASSSSARAPSICLSSPAGSLLEAPLKVGIPGAERGFATVDFMRRCVCFTDPSMRSVILHFVLLCDLASDGAHWSVFL